MEFDIQEKQKLFEQQQDLFTKGINVLVDCRVPTGNFCFTVYKNDGNTWKKVSPFMTSGTKNYFQALQQGIEFALNE